MKSINLKKLFSISIIFLSLIFSFTPQSAWVLEAAADKSDVVDAASESALTISSIKAKTLAFFTAKPRVILSRVEGDKLYQLTPGISVFGLPILVTGSIVDFGNAIAGSPTNSTRKQFRMTNESKFPVRVTALRIPANAGFVVTTALPADCVMAPRGTFEEGTAPGCQAELNFEVEFLPTFAHSYDSNIAIDVERVDNPRVKSTYRYRFSGKGIAGPKLSFVNFDPQGPVTLESSKAKEIMVMNANASGIALEISNVIVIGPAGFAADFDGYYQNKVLIQPGASTKLHLLYNGSQDAAGVLTFQTNDATQPVVQISLQGRAGVQQPRLLVLDKELEDAAIASLPAAILHNTDANTKLSYLGAVTVGGEATGRVYKIKNANGHALTITSVKNILAGSGSRLSIQFIDSTLAQTQVTTILKTLSARRLQSTPAKVIPVGGEAFLFVSVLPPTLDEAREQNFAGSLERGQIEIASDDPVTPKFTFNVAAALGAEKPLLCSGDNDNWVESDFSCNGKPEGTLCGSNDDGYSKVCNHGACVLMGDMNGDQRVSLEDIAAFIGDVDNNGVIDEDDDAAKVAMSANGQQGVWEKTGDFTCSGSIDQSSVEQFNRLANLVADYKNMEVYNSRVVETCERRDLIHNLAAYPTKGLGYAFKNGYIDFDTMKTLEADGVVKATTPLRYKMPELVCLDSLGNYDLETGEPVESVEPLTGRIIRYNDGKLTGRYLRTSISSSLISQPSMQELINPRNDFRVYFTGESAYPGYLPAGLAPETFLAGKRREAIMWASQVQLYYDITRYRNVFFNKRFAKALKLPPEIEKNVLYRQHRPDFNGGVGNTKEKPWVRALEATVPFSASKPGIITISANRNDMVPSVRTRIAVNGLDTQDVLNIAFDTSAADFPGLLAYWLLGDNRGFPSQSGFGQTDAWKTNVLPALSDALSAWEAFRITGDNALFADNHHLVSRWASSGCKLGTVSCVAKPSVDNVMMFGGNETNPSVFPFYDTSYSSTTARFDGLAGSDNAAYFIAGLVFDLARSVGLGEYRASLLLWKALQYVTDRDLYPMNRFATDIIRAARELFPLEDSEKSEFEESLRQALSARGLQVDGTGFEAILQPAVADSDGVLFASQHPLPQVQVLDSKKTQKGVFKGDSSASHYAFQFYQHSKLGPCDSFEITNGSYDSSGNYIPVSNGPSFRKVLTGKSLTNLVLLAPGHLFSWKVSANRCKDDLFSEYRMDTAAFGFRAVSALKDGFGVSAEEFAGKYIAFNILDSDQSDATYEIVASRSGGTVSNVFGKKLVITKSQLFNTGLTLKRLSGSAQEMHFLPFALEAMPRTISCIGSNVCAD